MHLVVALWELCAFLYMIWRCLLVSFFWTITEFMRKGRIEQSFYSAVKIVFAVVCLYLVVFSEKGGRGCWESSEFCSCCKPWDSPNLGDRTDFIISYSKLISTCFFLFFCSIFKEINDVLLTCAKIELQVSAASVLYELNCVLRTYWYIRIRL